MANRTVTLIRICKTEKGWRRYPLQLTVQRLLESRRNGDAVKGLIVAVLRDPSEQRVRSFLRFDPSGMFMLPGSADSVPIATPLSALFLPIDIFLGEITTANLVVDLLNRSNFHGSLQKRPAANPWNDKFGVPYPGLGSAIGQAIGIPNAGCEFGVCVDVANSLKPGQSEPPIATDIKNLLLRPWTISALIPISEDIPLGFAPTLTVDLKRNFVCLGGGVGIGDRAGIIAGPLFGKTDRAREILSGWSVSAALTGTLGGVQVVHDLSGYLVGPAFGSEGVSYSFTYSKCVDIVRR